MLRINLLFIFIMSFSIKVLDAKPASLMEEATNPRAILVTGASSGIGRNIAETLAQRGYYVFAGARKDSDIQTLSQIKNIQGIRLDVTIQSDIDSAVEMIRTSGRELYGLVNNAGVASFGPLIEIPEEELEFQMEVNVMGPFRVTKAFAPLIIKSKGRITTIGSVAGIASGLMFGPYSITKFSMEAYTEALAQEMKKFGVKVSIIEPGNYNSKVMENLQKRKKDQELRNSVSLYQEEYSQLAAFTHKDRSRFKDPDEVSQAIIKALFDESPELRYMVVPERKEAIYPIKSTLKKAAQLNQSQAYRFDQATMVSWLKEEMNKLKAQK